MRQFLSDEDLEIVGEEDRPLAIEAMARSLVPDVVVLGLEAGGNRSLCERIRVAAPEARVILWAAEEDRMQVIDPGPGSIREVSAGGVAELRRELLASQTKQEKK